MDDPILYMRAVERIVAVLLGGLCVSFGYKLFSKAADIGGELEVSHQNSKLLLKQVAPGVFFALFGCGVILSSIIKSYSYTTNRDGDQTISYNSNQLDIDSFPISETKNALYAVNAILNNPSPDLSSIPNIIKHKENLEIYRAIIIDRLTGKGSYVKFKSLEEKFLENRDSLSEMEILEYENIKDLLTAQ